MKINGLPTLLTCIYLTRACPRKCEYCRIRDSNLERELTTEEWIEAFKLLKRIGVDFNLILGNEIFVLGEGLIDITRFLEMDDISYAYYTTFPPKLFEEWRDKLLDAGVHNLSCAVDVVLGYAYMRDIGDIHQKSVDGMRGLTWARNNKIPDLQGQITVSKYNLDMVPEITEMLTKIGVWTGVNIVHYSKDGKYDFFPPKEEITNYVLDETDIPRMKEIGKLMAERIRSGEYKVQNVPEYFEEWHNFTGMTWHCTYPLILSIDADGSMRACGYRAGERSPKYSVFDLEDEWGDFIKDNEADRQECPGCSWSFWWLAEFYLKSDPNFSITYFQDHNSKYWEDKR